MREAVTKKYTLNDTLTFGKYRGKTLKAVLTRDAHYIQWCLDNISNFSLDEQAWDYAMSISSAFASHSAESPKATVRYECVPYSEGVEVLLINPWGKQMLKYAISNAEDIFPYEQPVAICAQEATQLQIQFDL